VIFWKTHQLAQELGIEAKDEAFHTHFKERIISSFWLPKEGYFLKDLSKESIANKHYSSDWLVTVTTRFLATDNTLELEYIKRSVQYIQEQRLDYPFGLKYQPDDQKSKPHLTVKLFAPTYATTSIWSNWGIEYNKILMQLFLVTCDRKYLTQASSQLDLYTNNILTYQGHPEVYDKNGLIFNRAFYKSVNKTGWVVNFEQALAMRSWIYKIEGSICPH